ncbi:DUF6263 family protein [Candidatus Palauibacter polyketidifaciens]|uniref:DUF6263 family protein n=1 Tax=Candidatus Palauibacter polyketidifaciens TaxID=3056740 RepID=UPI002383319D|nr:DUF6263 family protein [Candidatus Palauibacter polyketidifaciens]MDE2721056.1 DUF6263 family protein [Candidatus Palauibacter polyketidifaciens]
MKPVLRGVGTAALIAVAFALPVSGQTLLRLAPPDGQESRYIFSMEMTMENPMMPPGPAITLHARLTQTILGATEEGIRAGAVIDSSSMTSVIPGANAVDLSGSAFTIETDSRGRVLSVVADEAANSDAREFGEPLFEGTDFFWLPETEVAAGDSWTETVPVPMAVGGPAQVLDVELTYTLSSLEDGRATIAFSGAVESSVNIGGMPASISGELSGSMIVDLAEGRYVLQESLTKLEMVASGMAMPLETTTTLELVSDPS